ncbi:MAG: polysaccharide deacetylase family protein [Candidatus Marinimicrobia bacterium]|nr:polysaccharide deacetylase family protein [Candidatus Neomarinimicrobiota bacterium]
MKNKTLNIVNKVRHRYWRVIYDRRIRQFLGDKIIVCMTFDTEEDWDLENRLYYNSFKYIDSGALYELGCGLADRGISATFFVTTKVGKERPHVLTFLEEKGHAIGVHLHVHDLESCTRYPYRADEADAITSYDKSKKIEYMRRAKSCLEDLLTYEVVLYRSGRLQFDYETERVAVRTGFKLFANRRGIYRMGNADLWNVGVGSCDLFEFCRVYNLNCFLSLFEKERAGQNVIVFSAHPMSLYDYSTESVHRERFNLLWLFIDTLLQQSHIVFCNQKNMVDILKRYTGK